MNSSGKTTELPGAFDPTGTDTLQVIGKADKFNRWMYDTIRPYIQGETLEIGSGIGNISKFAIADHFSLTLSDYNPEYQEFLQENFSRFSNVRAILSIDLQHPDFIDRYSTLKEKFDTVFLLNVIEHLLNDPAAVENCRFLLKRNGHLIVLAPAYQMLFCRFDEELGHYRRYNRKKLQAIFPEQSFTIIKTFYFNFIGLSGWFVFGKLLKRKKIGLGEMSAFNNFVPIFKLADFLTFKKAGLSIIAIGKKN